MNLEIIRLRGRRRNRCQGEVRDVGRLVGGKLEGKIIQQGGMEEAPEKGK